MKRVAFTGIFIFLMVFLQAQSSFTDSTRVSRVSGLIPKKYDFGVSLGSEFSISSGFGSGFTTYISPHVSYNVSKRFRLSGGFTYSNTQLFNARSWVAGENVPGVSGNYSTGLIYVSGSYLVSDRLTISGSAFKAFNLSGTPLPYNPYSPISQKGAQGINFNVDYKVAEHFHIQAGFGFTQGVNPYYRDPFSPNSIQGGFYPGSGFGNSYPGRW